MKLDFVQKQRLQKESPAIQNTSITLTFSSLKTDMRGAMIFSPSSDLYLSP